VSSTYSSGDTVFQTEKPCLDCGQPTSESMPDIRGKAYLCQNCQNQEESENKDVIFDGSNDQEQQEDEVDA
jgi:hypothetical protein